MASSPKKKKAATKVTRTTEKSESSPSIMRTVIVVIALLIGLGALGYYINTTRSDTADSDESSQVTESENGDESATGDESDQEAATGDEQDTSENAPQTETGETTASETDTAYAYTVGNGESYTNLARLAVADADSGLSTAERVAAETKLTQDAGAQMLEVGQSVELSKEAVNAAVEYAKNLSAEQKAAWQPYADLVAW